MACGHELLTASLPECLSRPTPPVYCSTSGLMTMTLGVASATESLHLTPTNGRRAVDRQLDSASRPVDALFGSPQSPLLLAACGMHPTIPRIPEQKQFSPTSSQPRSAGTPPLMTPFRFHRHAIYLRIDLQPQIGHPGKACVTQTIIEGGLF